MKFDDEYLEVVTSWLEQFFEGMTDSYYMPYPEGNKVLKKSVMSTMFFKLIEQGLFSDSKAISRGIALDMGILFPHTVIDELIKKD